MPRAKAAYTAQPNTAETDRMKRVKHIVEMDDGTKREVYATDPIDAINIVNDMVGKSFGEVYGKFCGAIKGLPSDLASQHEHYRLGTPKRR